MHVSWKIILLLCLGTALIGYAAFANSFPFDQGGIEGFVSDALAQSAIPGAKVELFVSPPPGQTVANFFVVETVTDENGFYKIENLPALYYVSRYSKDGYEEAMEKIQIQPNRIINLNVLLQPAGAPTPAPTPLPKALLHGRVVEDVGVLTIAPSPVPNAHIMVFHSWITPGGETSPEPALFLEAYTNEEGLYEIPEIPYGSYCVIAQAEDYYGEKALIEIKESDIEQNFDLKKTLPPTPLPTPPPDKSGEVFGIVAGWNEDGATTHPLAGAVIEVFKAIPDEEEGSKCIPPPILQAVTDENGLYDIPNIPEGFWQIVARAEGYLPMVQEVDIIPDEKTEMNFILNFFSEPTPTPAGPVIKGRVFEKCFQTNDLKPIAGALVKIQKLVSALDISTSPPLLVYTDQEGFYIAENLEPGYYSMEAQADVYYPGFRHVLLGFDEIKIVHFALAPIPPEPTQTPLPENGSLYGVVFALGPQKCDGPTTPIAGALVSLYPLLKESIWKDPGVVASAVTNESGQYQIPDIPPGCYVAVAEAAGFLRCVKNVIMPPGESIRLNFGLRPDVAPQPTPVPGMGNISGQVMSIAPDELLEPLPGASVLLFSIPCFKSDILPGPIRQTFTNEEGKFEMPDVPEGDYVLMAKAEGYAPETAPVHVITGETQEVILKLRLIALPTPTPSPLTGTIEGHVAFDSGGNLIPIPSAQLFAIRLGNKAQDLFGDFLTNHTATDENGYYQFSPLVEGQYLVVATAEGYYPSQAEGGVLPEQITTMDFVLKVFDFPTTGTGILFGRVMTVDAPTTPGCPPNLIPLKEANILALNVHQALVDEEALIPAGKAVTDENGEYLVENLPGGMYAVIAEKDGYSRGIKDARVRPMIPTRVNFLLIPLGASPPDPGKKIVFESSFDDTEENWEPAGAPNAFRMPQNIHEKGRLQLACSDNLNTFGFWHSPLDAVPLNTDVIYKASFAISSDVTDAAKVPCIRIRFNSQSEQMADMMAINSLGDAAVSPGPEGRTYTLYFTLPSQEILMPENENDIYVSFDVVNMDKGDAPNATVALDWVKIEAISTASLPQGTEIASLDFTQGAYGWGNQFAEELFSAPTPLSAPESGGLALKSVNNTKTYGVWASPVNLISMEGDVIYAIRWSVYSDRLETSSVPGIRLRAGDEQNRLIMQKCIFSNAEGDNSPTVEGRDYVMYYTAPPELDGAGLALAFDLVNFDKTDAPEGTIGVRSVTVRAIPAEQMP